MSRDMRGLTQKKSPFRADGTDVVRPLVDGTSQLLLLLTLSINPQDLILTAPYMSIFPHHTTTFKLSFLPFALVHYTVFLASLELLLCDILLHHLTFMDIRDLLVRHEKLVHLNESSKENTRPRRSSSSTASHKPSLSDGHGDPVTIQPRPVQPAPGPSPPQPMYHPQPVMNQDPGPPHLHDQRLNARLGACNLDVLSDAALASEVNSMPPILNNISQQPTSHTRTKGFGEPVNSYSDRSRQDQQVLPPTFQNQPPQQPQHQHHQQQHQQSYDDYNVFLDEFSVAPHFLPPHFEPDQPMGMWSRSPANTNMRHAVKPPSQFGSRIGSLAPDQRDGTDGGERPSPLRISVADHATIKNKLDEFSSVLPNDFVFPSRHTLTRFVEGYISGFHDLLPILHLPTLSPAEIAPELLLAILAVGAQYRFESNRGYALWYAAKAVATEQIRRRHSSEVHALLPTAASYSPHSTRPSPSSSYRNSFASGQSEKATLAGQENQREP